ncbi:MAG TPA: dephospho-CoA kinase [Bryobacterales bacterium]|nr:dephospho-CoA kinase [Bryobacterales bacterium]
MLKVGLTGGLATGKTHVAGVLAGLGCHVLSADEIGHQVLLPGGEAYDDVRKEFGPQILGADGRIDRRLLATQVFEHPERLEKLNLLVHPHVIRREELWLAQIRAAEPRAIAVIEAAILIETGSYKRFDRLILTVCSPEVQVRRHMERSGESEAETRARLARQMPLEAKRRYADYVIDTSGSREDTGRQVREVFRQLSALAQPPGPARFAQEAL